MNPHQLLYTREHEWVLVEDDMATIGITNFAQQELGEVVFADLPQVGDIFAQDDEFGTVESVKAVSELYMPIAGEVLEVNNEVSDDPELINDDPYGDGWLIKVKIHNTEELKGLMDSDAYDEFVSSGEA